MEKNTMVDRLVIHFMGGYPLAHIFKEPLQNVSWEDQIKIRDKTIRSPLLKRYPLKKTYIEAFLKKFIKVLETTSEHVHDDFYNDLCTTITSNFDDTYCFKHFLLQNIVCHDISDRVSHVITIKESSKLISDGTTGLRTWEAALVLADWSLCNKSYLTKKKVLELGSGVGLTGMIIAKYCDISKLWMSDCHNQVLKMLHENTVINFPNLSTKAVEYDQDKHKIGILRLPWEEIEDLPKQIIPDIVIGADIVYDPSIFEPLCNVFKYFGTINGDIKILMVNTIRNENTSNKFFTHLDENNFKVRRLDMIKSHHLVWDEDHKYNIMEIVFS